MSWKGRFHFGKDWAAYLGASSDNAEHAHAAIQICLGFGEPVTLARGRTRAAVGDALYVRSCVTHRLEPIKRVLIVLVEPHSARGRDLSRLLPDDQIGHCPPEVTALINVGAPLAECFREGARDVPDQVKGIDLRLAKALDRLLAASQNNSLAKVAGEVGLSPSRLRHIAQTQLGLPLSKYVLWRKLGMASRALARGETLASAAVAGGFTDQAHFTKCMRALIGVTPGTAQGPLS